jgi:hypothetical protein
MDGVGSRVVMHATIYPLDRKRDWTGKEDKVSLCIGKRLTADT